MLCHSVSMAQDYEFAAGIRVGGSPGLTFKQLNADESGFCGMLTFQNAGLQLVALRQYQHPIFAERKGQLFFFYGYGVHTGYNRLSPDIKEAKDGDRYRDVGFWFLLGADANIGLEYHFIRRPIAVTLDYRPMIQINLPYYHFRQHDIALSLLYTF